MNDDFISAEGPQPTSSNRRTIIIVVVVVAVVCCCCAIFLYTAYNYWGDLLLEYLGY
jgi:hypothetical protein